MQLASSIFYLSSFFLSVFLPPLSYLLSSLLPSPYYIYRVYLFIYLLSFFPTHRVSRCLETTHTFTTRRRRWEERAVVARSVAARVQKSSALRSVDCWRRRHHSASRSAETRDCAGRAGTQRDEAFPMLCGRISHDLQRFSLVVWASLSSKS